MENQSPEEIIETFIRDEASKFPNGTEEEELYRFRNLILFIEEEKQYPSVKNTIESARQFLLDEGRKEIESVGKGMTGEFIVTPKQMVWYANSVSQSVKPLTEDEGNILLKKIESWIRKSYPHPQRNKQTKTEWEGWVSNQIWFIFNFLSQSEPDEKTIINL
jgi:hypothetical protein